MEKQILFYSNVKPLNSEQHSGLFLRDDTGFAFAGEVNAVPLTTVEFAKAAAEYAIVFAGEKDALTPYAVLSMTNGKNSYIDETGVFNAAYIPAFVRRYPFVFTTFDEGKNFTLCVDVDSPALNEDGIGQRLFEEDGSQSARLSRTVAFMTEYQRQFNKTRNFCKKLGELDVLAPFTAKIEGKTIESQALTGFYAVSRERVKELTDAQLRQLVQSEELELIYNHIQSVANFNRYVTN